MRLVTFAAIFSPIGVVALLFYSRDAVKTGSPPFPALNSPRPSNSAQRTSTVTTLSSTIESGNRKSLADVSNPPSSDTANPPALTSRSTAEPTNTQDQPNPSGAKNETVAIALNGRFVPQSRAKIAARIDAEYSDFFAQLQNRGTNTQKLREMLIERQMIGNDYVDVAQAYGFSINSELHEKKDLPNLIKASSTQYQEEIRAAIGETDYNALKLFEIKRPERNLAEDLNNRLASSGQSLTKEQREEFVDTLYTARDANRGRRITNGYVGATKPVRNDSGPVRIIPENAINVLRPILTTSQLAMLQEIYKEQHR